MCARNGVYGYESAGQTTFSVYNRTKNLQTRPNKINNLPNVLNSRRDWRPPRPGGHLALPIPSQLSPSACSSRPWVVSSLPHEDLLAYECFLADPQPAARWVLTGNKKLARNHPVPVCRPAVARQRAPGHGHPESLLCLAHRNRPPCRQPILRPRITLPEPSGLRRCGLSSSIRAGRARQWSHGMQR